MKNTGKRLPAAVLAVVMLASLSFVAFAAQGDDDEFKVVVSMEGLTLGQGLYYEPQVPEGIEKICLEKDFPQISVCNYEAGIGITADEHVGQKISIFGIDGRCLGQSVVRHGENYFDIPSKGPIVIRIGNCASVKVIR